LYTVQGTRPDASLGQNKPFKDLALGLASRGIAVLSYDKRTYLYGPEVVDAIETLRLRMRRWTMP
jgi:hypothetical protein